MSQAKFAEMVRESLSTLALDAKALSRLADDPDLDDVSRAEVAGAALLLLSGTNVIPGLRGVQAYVDDTLMMRIVVERASKRTPEAVAKHEDGSSLVADCARHLEAARAFLGESFGALERAVDGLKQHKVDGHTVADCVADDDGATWLYESIIAETVRLDFPESEVIKTSKLTDAIATQLRSKAGIR